MRNQQSDIIAVASLRLIDGFTLLTAVAVKEDYQGRGCARALLSAMKSVFDERTYTFSLEQLCHFYSDVGFHLLTEDQLPQPLQDRFRAYQTQGRQIIPMGFL